MGKKNKNKSTTKIREDCTIFGSMNGWLKVIINDDEEIVFRPKEHTEREEPVRYYSIGRFTFLTDL